MARVKLDGVGGSHTKEFSKGGVGIRLTHRVGLDASFGVKGWGGTLHTFKVMLRERYGYFA
eukprot:754009-Hanusia_phi.AAC.3